MKALLRLYMFAVAVLGILAIIQRKEIKELNETIDKQDNLMEIQGEIVDGYHRGLKIIERWRMDKKITLDMAYEYVTTIDVDDETRSKLKNL